MLSLTVQGSRSEPSGDDTVVQHLPEPLDAQVAEQDRRVAVEGNAGDLDK